MFSTLHPVDLRGHDEVALGETVDLMRPQRNLHFSPGKQKVRMMPLFLRQCANTVDELECLGEIGKLVFPSEVVLLNDVPLRNDLVQRRKLLPLKWRNSPAAGNALFIS